MLTTGQLSLLHLIKKTVIKNQKLKKNKNQWALEKSSISRDKPELLPSVRAQQPDEVERFLCWAHADED